MNGWDMVGLWDWWMSTETAALPQTAVATVYRHLGWAVVLAWVVQRWLGWRAAACVGVWACVPGTVGLTHWLGLAFQSPSLLAVAWCMGSLQGRWQLPDAPMPMPRSLLVFVLGLGWLLVADLLAWFPVSLYAWGFSPAALGLVALLTVAYGVAGDGRLAAPFQATPCWSGWWLAACLVVFAGLRLPSGNAWDAVHDPWLWLVCHGVAYRRWRSALRSRGDAA